MMGKYADRAAELFKNGHNCAQSVYAAFAERYDISEEDALKCASSFGGGMAQMREVCGALSGMFMAAGNIFGYAKPDLVQKKAHNERLQRLANEFREKCGSIICRELIKLRAEGATFQTPSGEKHTVRCLDLVVIAAEILEREIEKEGL